MSAAELRGVYMIDTYAAFRWLRSKFSVPARRKSNHKKERHSISHHTFFYVPQHGEAAAEDTANVLGQLNRKRTKEMEGGAGSNSMEHFDFIATGNVSNIVQRWVSHTCVPCLDGNFGKCTEAGTGENKPKEMIVKEKSYSGASESKALERERTDDTVGKLEVGQFVALWQGSGTSGSSYTVARVAKMPRKSKAGELVGGAHVVSGQSWLVEVHWGELVKQHKKAPEMYKFEQGEFCEKTNDMCGSALGCSKIHSDLVFVSVIQPPLDLTMEQANKQRASRRQQKQHKIQAAKQQQPASSAPEFWLLPPQEASNFTVNSSRYPEWIHAHKAHLMLFVTYRYTQPHIYNYTAARAALQIRLTRKI